MTLMGNQELNFQYQSDDVKGREIRETKTPRDQNTSKIILSVYKVNFVYLLAWQILGDKIEYYSSKNQTKAMAENDLSLKIYFSRLKKPHYC